jgi:HSP20 family protein
MEEVFDRFNRPFVRHGSRREGGQEVMTIADWAPAVEISESEGEYLIKMELPEVRKEDVKVSVNQGVLTIQGERKAEREESGKKYHRVERCYGTFARSFTLPDDAKDDAIRARFKDGMLHLHIGKSEQVKPKAIEIKVD